MLPRFQERIHPNYPHYTIVVQSYKPFFSLVKRIAVMNSYWEIFGSWNIYKKPRKLGYLAQFAYCKEEFLIWLSFTFFTCSYYSLVNLSDHGWFVHLIEFERHYAIIIPFARYPMVKIINASLFRFFFAMTNLVWDSTSPYQL